MISYIGDFAEDETVYVVFNTFSSDDPSASCTITNLSDTDVHIHKDDGLTQRTNAAGITVSIDFDGITGSHMIKIDTSDDTVAGFWVTAHDYFVRIEGTTVDGGTINAVVGHFSIENRSTATPLSAIVTDTAEIGVAGAGLTDLGGMSTGMKAEVNTEVADVSRVDTVSEPSQGAPPATPTPEQMIAYLYFSLRNKTVTTSQEKAVYDNAGTTKIMKETLSDNNVTFTESEYISGA